MDFFKGRTVFVATMHGKERVLSPLLEKELGVQCVTSTTFDTDVFGTFSGEIERKLSPLETLKSKCIQGMKSFKSEIGIATEGSFGPHPYLFSIPAHDEMIVFIDAKNQLEVTARMLVTNTNFQGRLIETEGDLLKFMEDVHFPSHSIILKDKAEHFHQAYKDAQTEDELLHQFERCQQTFGSVYAETDMRAMRNPTRMNVIEMVCEKLIEKIKNTCPTCQTPGFDVVEQIPGLPCSLCHMPTSSVLAERFECQKCLFTVQRNRKDEKLVEDPMYCSSCNP